MSIAERPAGGVERAGGAAAARREMPRAPLDVRLPWPLGRAMLVAAVLGALAFGIGTAVLGSNLYQGKLSLLVLKLNQPSPSRGIEIVDRRVTAITAIARSENFLVELQRETGVDLSLDELGSMIDATRPNFGAIALITVSGHDEQVVKTLTEHLSTAMSTVVDRVRSDTGNDLDSGNGANIGVGDDPDYTGPLYLELFTDLSEGQTTGLGVTGPRTIVHGFMGALLAVIVLGAYGAIAHERSRVSSTEDLEVLLDVEQLGSVPRPVRRRRHGQQNARVLMGFANEVAGIPGEQRFAVGFAGAGTPRLRRRFVRCMATTMAAVTGQPVVVVDLAEQRGPLGGRRARRPGVLDAVPSEATPAPLRRIARWRLPRWAARLGRGVAVEQVGLGRLPDESVDADERLCESVAALTRDHVVLVNLPRIPGPIAIGSMLGVLDVGVVVLLDGWTRLDTARVVSDALAAGTAGPVGSVLIEN